MSTITADPTLLQVLSQMKEKTEIRDPDGNLVGVYTPTTEVEKSLIEKACMLVDRAELERRKSEEGGKGIPTAEVLRHLESLGNAK